MLLYIKETRSIFHKSIIQDFINILSNKLDCSKNIAQTYSMTKEILIISGVILNFCSLLLILTDKYLSKKHFRRIPENQLLLFAALGGWILGAITMKLIRHKTSKKSFKIKYVLSSLLSSIVIFLLYFSVQIGWW